MYIVIMQHGFYHFHSKALMNVKSTKTGDTFPDHMFQNTFKHYFFVPYLTMSELIVCALCHSVGITLPCHDKGS